MLALVSASAQAQHGWPIEPMNSEHPVGNSFGEFQDYGGGVYQHQGIDILETPKFQSDGTEDLSAPWVRATVGGTVSQLSDNAATAYNGTTLNGTDGVTYRYWHLEHGSYHVDYVNHHNNGTAVAASDRIAKLVRWSCDFHHLHYDLASGGNYLDPLADITPNPDPDRPEFLAIGFAQNNTNPWVQLNPIAPGACTVVSGQTDIIAQLRDRDDAGSTLTGTDTLWLHNVRWRACPDTSPSCPWQDTHEFNDMPTSWGVNGNAASSAQFSNRTPWESSSDYCATTWLYGIVTNYVGGTPNVAGSLDTTALTDGSYSVSVEATDFAGNVRVYNTRACVRNGPGCITEMAVRDATDDTGAIPYPGGNWWVSPDITANPGTPDEDHNINVGAPNPIEVRVWNYGSCDLPVGTSYNVCLGWGLPSSTVPYPLPAGQVIGCQTETVPAAGWSVGTSRIANFTWTPTAGSIPLGHHCLVAWVDMPQDAVLNTPAVNWDDNRAQQNITFQAAPSPREPAYTSFWIHPQRMFEERSLELIFEYSGQRPTLQEARLHIAPGLMIKRVLGGHIIGGYEGEKPIDPCRQDPSEPCRNACTTWEEALERGCTRIIGGIDPNGRLRLEGIRVRKPVRLTLEVWPEEKVRKGQFADAEVVEYGRLLDHKEITPVGGMTLRFEH
jgi:hypothetical protein